ncbi:hypothetical protein YC2023_069560 [Brassica napus]
MHRDTTTGSSRCLGAITPCQRESLVITGQTSHVLLSRTELERCIYDVRMRRTKTEPPSHHHRTYQIHTVVSRKPLEEAVMSPESRDSRRSTLGVVYAAAQLSRPVVPRLQRSINRLRACVTEHIFGGVFGLLVGSECETDEYMIFGWIGATGLYFGFLFGLRVSGVVYMGYYAMRYCWWHAVLQIGGDGSGYVTFLFPPYLKQSFHEFLLLEIMWCDFVISWGSLLDWECGSLRCIDIGVTLGFVVDLASRYHQIAIDDEDVRKTTFRIMDFMSF